MSRPRYACSTAGISEQIAEAFFSKRITVFARDERQVPARTSSERFGEHGQDRKCDHRVGLLRLERRDTIADMLPPKANGVATTQSSIEQYIKPYPLPRADRPAFLVGGNVLLGPWRKTVAFRAWRVSHAYCRIGLHKAGFERPTEQAAQSVQEMSCLEWDHGLPQ